LARFRLDADGIGAAKHQVVQFGTCFVLSDDALNFLAGFVSSHQFHVLDDGVVFSNARLQNDARRLVQLLDGFLKLFQHGIAEEEFGESTGPFALLVAAREKLQEELLDAFSSFSAAAV
jgi:hypothetical protein